MCVDRDQIIDVVFAGYASKVESIVGHISPLENPNLGPLEYDCAAANTALNKLGYKRGSDGIRVVPATTGANAQGEHPMSYEILTPTSTDFNVDRSFDIVKDGFARLGVKVTQKVGGDATATYAIQTGDCSGPKSKQYQGYDIAMWDWVGYLDPDFMLSVVTKGQWCSWSDTGANNPAYDKLYVKQGVTVDPEARKDGRVRAAEDRLRQLLLHPAHESRGNRRDRQGVDRLRVGARRLLQGLLHVTAPTLR